MHVAVLGAGGRGREIAGQCAVAGLEDLVDRLDDRFDPPGILYEKPDAVATGKRASEGLYVREDGTSVESAERNPTVVTREKGAVAPLR